MGSKTWFWLGGMMAVWVLLRIHLSILGFNQGSSRDHGGIAASFHASPTGSDELLVVAHGGLASKETLALLCSEATHREVDCMAVDLLGHGASAPLPDTGITQAATASLRADYDINSTNQFPSKGYRRVHFIGHSMGALLGCGRAFSCEQSTAIGQDSVPCGRVVMGEVHKMLGLSDRFYLLSHVLEPWTPSVIERALDLELGRSNKPSNLRATVVVLWAQFFLAAAIGILLARRIRHAPWPFWLRASASAFALWSCLAIACHRALWYLIPTQSHDLLVVSSVVATSFLLASILKYLHIQSSSVGLALSAAVAWSASIAIWALAKPSTFSGLLVLPPILMFVLIFAVAIAERLSRSSQSEICESAIFSSLLLSVFLALLLYQ